MTAEQELEQIAQRLRVLARQHGPSARAAAADDIDPIYDRLRAARIARILYRMRRERGSFLDESVFGEPAWDMLLDLAIHAIDGRKVSVTDLAAAAQVPPSTALRYIAMLVDKNLIKREPDPEDARRVFVSLQPAAEIALNRHLLRCGAAMELLSGPMSASGRAAW